MRLKVLSPQELLPKACVIVGTRPGIIKQAPTVRALQKAGLDFFLIHTGQHYSYEMDAQFFSDLRLPRPAYRLDQVRYMPTHGGQTAEMLRGVEDALLVEKPRVVIVVGDANTNLAGALAGRKLQLVVAHIEAGLRSHDWRMPEEHNRVMIDHISDFLFAPTEACRENLVREQVRGRTFVVGNTIVDAVQQNLGIARRRSRVLGRLGLEQGRYVVLTCHREETVDTRQNLALVLESAAALATRHPELPMIFPIHPRTSQRLTHFGLDHLVQSTTSLRVISPLGYLDFLRLLEASALVLTDSGGIQEEACILRVPCVTLRENTERPETVEAGANLVAGLRPARVVQAVEQMLTTSRNWPNPFGDGKAGERIVEILAGAVAGD